MEAPDDGVGMDLVEFASASRAQQARSDFDVRVLGGIRDQLEREGQAAVRLIASSSACCAAEPGKGGLVDVTA